ncbi:unnamed protein product [Microthlaspi erraticum]|uniref:Uncharacterized protein n=1 Tax=Microthlaspi erraticum TaxID=1685480 RepID=A0A6D2K7S7_9BRAS|nr:unnamed protein product [Microthlaspi erraticum]
MNLFDSEDGALCSKWLNTRPQGSVVYVAFGSLAELNNMQMEELASAISNFSFLWVVRSSEEEKLPSGFLETVDKDKSLVLKWSPQLEVLANKAIGLFHDSLWLELNHGSVDLWGANGGYASMDRSTDECKVHSRCVEGWSSCKGGERKWDCQKRGD